MTRTTIPMPPSQCVVARHISMPRGTGSISRMTDAPVVVKPDIASKYASVKEGIVPSNMYGRQPTNEAAIHASVTHAIASRAPMLPRFAPRPASARRPDSARPASAESRNALMSRVPSATAQMNGKPIETVTVKVIIARNLATIA